MMQTKKPPLSRRLLLYRDQGCRHLSSARLDCPERIRADPFRGELQQKPAPAKADVVFFVCSLLQTSLQRYQTKKPPLSRRLLLCRDDWIRTSDPLHPMQVRYRAALRPALCLLIIADAVHLADRPAPGSLERPAFSNGLQK